MNAKANSSHKEVIALSSQIDRLFKLKECCCLMVGFGRVSVLDCVVLGHLLAERSENFIGWCSHNSGNCDLTPSTCSVSFHFLSME